MARQTNTDTSPATLFSSGKMYEIVLDGTFDGESPFSIRSSSILMVFVAQFPEHSSATGRNLGPVFNQLKDM